MFARKRKDSLAARAIEEKLFDLIATELQAGNRKEGLWLKAATKCGGDESRRESEYVKKQKGRSNVRMTKDELHSSIRNEQK